MFGEISLSGIDKVIVKNNSIKLPKFSLAEGKEVLCLLYLPDEIRIYSEKDYNKFVSIVIEKYKNGIINSSIKDKLIRYLVGYGYDEARVKKDKTIKSLKFLKENLELILVGSNDHIKALSLEQYNIYKNKKV